MAQRHLILADFLICVCLLLIRPGHDEATRHETVKDWQH